MVKKTITIGRAPDNNKVFPMGDISGHHARVHLLDDGMFKIEDLNSANGTYVNGYRIKTATVSAVDQVRLSARLVIDLPVLFGIKKGAEVKQTATKETSKNNVKDFTKEFAGLETVYQQYKKERAEMLKHHNRRLSLIRGGITFSPMLVLLLGSALVSPEFRSGLMGITILGSTAASFLTSGIGIQDKLEEMDVNFRIRYVCPNPDCQHQLNGQPWRLIHATGFCPKCGAIYNKSKL